MVHYNTEYMFFKANASRRASRRGAIRRERLRRGALRAFRSFRRSALPYVLGGISIFGFTIGAHDAGTILGSAAVAIWLSAN